MRNPRRSERPRPQPWAVYLLIGVAAFASGSALTSWFRPNEHTSPAAPASPPSIAPNSGAAALPPNASPVELGNWYYDHGQWSEAIAHYERAISQGIDNPNVRTDLGNAFRFSGNPRKALEHYQTAQRQNPQHEESLFNQGSLYSQSLGDPMTAAAKWREFISRFPTSPRAADARRMLGEFEKEFGAPAAASPSRAP